MDRRLFFEKLGSLSAIAVLRPDAVGHIQDAVSHVRHLSPEEAARDEDFWFQVRHAFTIDRNQINLNSGSVSPAPRVVQEAMKQYLSIVHMSPSLWVDEMLIPQQEMLRRKLADEFGCDSEELAITRNTSESLQIVQLGLELNKGTSYGFSTSRIAVYGKLVPEEQEQEWHYQKEPFIRVAVGTENIKDI